MKKSFVLFALLLFVQFFSPYSSFSQGTTCGVSVSVQSLGFNEQDSCCSFRVILDNKRSDVRMVSFTIYNGSVQSVSPEGPTGAWGHNPVWGFFATPSYSPNYPKDSAYPIGTVCVRAMGVFTVVVSFLDGNQQVICEQKLEGDCDVRPQSNPCKVTSLTINTGYDPSTGGVLPPSNPPGSVNDPYWTVIQDPLPGTNEPRPATTIQPFPYGWVPPLPGSQWIAVYNSASNSTNGVYVYERCFCVEGQLRVRINLQMYADDIIDSVKLDGNSLNIIPPSGNGNWFQYPSKIDTSVTLVSGKHCLRFYVRNTHAAAHGLDVAGSITNMSPVPGGFVLADSCCSPTAWIIGQKIHDLNCNGKPDEGEPVLQGWTITATNGTNTYTGTTGSDGWYSIQVPAPGTYTISEQVKPGFTPSSGGPFTVTVQQGQVYTYTFLNCSAPPPCDTIGDIRLDSSCCTFSVPIFTVSPVSSIKWAVSDGYMESIFSMPCPGTFTPPNPYGATSGTITYAPACTSSPMNLTFEVSPTTASGIVTVTLVITHTNGQKCEKRLEFKCKRAPLVKCDSLAVSPFTFVGLNLSGRTFKIFNQKVPPAPICSVKISLNPDPDTSSMTFKWQGGGLSIDGDNSRIWGTANSGTPYYSLINCSSSNAPQGSPANSTIEFNLGVDYTLGWTGNVILTVIHCDGDTCTLTYNNWCAKPGKQCIIKIDIGIDSIHFSNPLVAGGFKLTKADAAYATIALDSSWFDNAEIISASLWFEDPRGNFIGSAQSSLIGGQNEKLRRTTRSGLKFDFDGMKNKEATVKGVVVFEKYRDEEPVKFEVVLYDENSNPIGIELFETSTQVSSVDIEKVKADDTGAQLIIVPNPTTGELRVRYATPTEGNVQIAIVDILGNRVATTLPVWKDKGFYEQMFDLKNLPSGRYNVFLYLPNGSVLTETLMISR